MGISKKWISIFIVAIILVAAFNIFLSNVNSFKQDGELAIKGLKNQVIVKRDEKGMAYIFADSLHDALFSQGFVTAQDRYFSMEMIRRISKGQLSEVLGEKTKSTDIRMRTIGFQRNAQKHAQILEDKERELFQIYADGINAFLDNNPAEIHLKLKLMGVKPDHWTVVDVLTVMYFMGWGSSANLGDEVVAQMLVEKLGFQDASEIFPSNINPHDP